jgi:hypothetical protein
MLRSLFAFLAVASLGLAFVGCSGRLAASGGGVDAGSDVALGTVFSCSESCLDNSFCDGGTVCAFGTCQPACAQAASCPAGTFCLDDGVTAACVDRNAPCEQGTCSSPLECATDHRCRNTCTTTAECNTLGITGRVCAMDGNGIGFCADPSDVVAGVIVAAPPPGASSAPVMPPSDGSTDAAPVVYATSDGGGPLPYDETTGIPCANDEVCHNPNGPGINQCSSGFTVPFYGAAVQLWATPVCVIPPNPLGNCYPGMDSTDVHFCDGPVDDPNSPGVCIALDPSNPLAGLCVPKCTFAADGSAASGCVGHNACGYITDILSVSKNVPIGIGYCKSACATDSDCTDLRSDYECQTDTGDCTLVAAVRTKGLGDACSTAGSQNDETAGACLCANGADGSGFCTKQCIVGGAACPAGWVCESGEPSTLDFGSESTVALTAPTKGLLGNCIPACTPSEAGASVDADDADAQEDGSPGVSAVDATFVAAEAGGACPAGSTCSAGTIAGPDCLH